MPVTRRISVPQYDKDIANAEKRGFDAARRRLEGEDAPPQLTHEDLRQMSPEEINERWGEVSRALESGAAAAQPASEDAA